MEKFTDIPYIPHSTHTKHQLDIFAPSKEGVFPVLIFIHGGSWHNGCKELYHPLGINLAQKDIVTVIINYRLGNEANYKQMASDCASAVSWTYHNIQNYKGHTSKIFVAGHSAGGHLSALISLNQKFFQGIGEINPLSGCILIDAFGLNIDYVMHNNTSFFVRELEKVFTKDPTKWKEAAPVNFIKGNNLPFLIFTGDRTYPYLTMDNEVFKMNLEEQKIPFLHKTIRNRNHVEMITCLNNKEEAMYNDLMSFVHEYSMV